MSLSLDDFEWSEVTFDRWHLINKKQCYTIATITNFNGWYVRVCFDPSQAEPLHVDILDAAKVIAQITATQHMEKYHDKFGNLPHRKRTPEFRPNKIPKRVLRMA